MIQQGLSKLAEMSIHGGLAYFSLSQLPKMQSLAGPVSLVHAVVYQTLSNTFHIEEKPRLVQTAFQFVSGLAVTAISSSLL